MTVQFTLEEYHEDLFKGRIVYSSDSDTTEEDNDMQYADSDTDEDNDTQYSATESFANTHKRFYFVFMLILCIIAISVKMSDKIECDTTEWNKIVLINTQICEAVTTIRVYISSIYRQI
jgi:hypothetical protein